MERSVHGVVLETARLVLRQFTMSDVDSLAGLDADPDVMCLIAGGVAASRGEIRDDILPAFMAWYRRPGGYGCRAAEERLTGDFPGRFGFHPRRAGPCGEIVLGFRLGKAGWGTGYATGGSRALIRRGFTGLGAWRAVAETMAVNLASRRVLEKAVLNLVRVFHQPWPCQVDGRELGDAGYAVSKGEWEQLNGIKHRAGERGGWGGSGHRAPPGQAETRGWANADPSD